MSITEVYLITLAPDPGSNRSNPAFGASWTTFVDFINERNQSAEQDKRPERSEILGNPPYASNKIFIATNDPMLKSELYLRKEFIRRIDFQGIHRPQIKLQLLIPEPAKLEPH